MTEYFSLFGKLSSFLNGIAMTKISIEPLRDAIYSFALFGMTQQQKGMLEQHIGTVLQVMVVGLLAWSLNTSVALRTEVSVLQNQMTMLQATIAQGTSDIYRASTATRDNATLWDSINRMAARLSAAEDAIQKHRAEVNGMPGARK